MTTPINHRGRPLGDGSPYSVGNGPVPDGSAVTDSNEPFAVLLETNRMYSSFPGWAPEETPMQNSMWRDNNEAYQANGVATGMTEHEAYFYGNKSQLHIHTINDKAENVVWSDTGPESITRSPGARGALPLEPNNHPPDDPRRVAFGGVGYVFLRTWIDAVRDSSYFTGAHVSLADNRVINDVGGMAPNHRRNMRNTYRIEPEPWDQNLVDLNVSPNTNPSQPKSMADYVDVSGPSYRLG